MNPLALHEFHTALHAAFLEINGMEVVADYGDWKREHAAFHWSAGVVDLSFRSRICLTGSDRVRFLHGQVTNDIQQLQPGGGCYAAIVSAKGRMEGDCYTYHLPEELLLDFEPGLQESVTQRLEKYIVSDDVQVVSVASLYGLLSVQGPRSEEVVNALGSFQSLPGAPFEFVAASDAVLGEMYLMNQPRLGARGFDLFVPTASLGVVADKLIAAARQVGGKPCGWQAVEAVRIEAGLPRYGADMDDRNLPPECGIERRALNYQKGCYIGQEVLNRIHTMGHVNRKLCGLRLPASLSSLPAKDDKLFFEEKEVGYVTTSVASPDLGNIALGYVRTESAQPGIRLTLRIAGTEGAVEVAELPFRR
jgi:folate-binding protein YgfZ